MINQIFPDMLTYEIIQLWKKKKKT